MSWETDYREWYQARLERMKNNLDKIEANIDRPKEIVLLEADKITASDVARFRREGYSTMMINGVFRAER